MDITDHGTLATLLAMLADPEARRRHEAARLCTTIMRDAVLMNMAGPKKGGLVRCVFADGGKAFETDAFEFEIGRVYEVVANGLEAFDMDADNDTSSDEAKAQARANMVRTAEKYPDSLSLCVMLRDPASGLMQRVTFPSYPGFVFVEAEEGDTDNLEHVTDVAAGDTLTFSKVVEAIACGSVAENVPYIVRHVEAACDCDNPGCPGKGRVFAHIHDKDGDVCRVTLPYSYLGVASVQRD